MKQIEQRILERLVIDETSPSGLRWNQFAVPKVKGKPAGKVDSRGYWQVSLRFDGEEKRFAAHRAVWFLANGQWPKEEIDHINGNKKDNRLSNLRESSRCENEFNKGLRKDNSSGVKGVSFYKDIGKWCARLNNKCKPIYLGLFSNISDAEKAVMDAREKLHGEFANHGIDTASPMT